MKAFIFDCDGVLVDSEKLSCGALNIIFDKFFGVDIGKDYTPIIGRELKDSIGYYLQKYQLTGVDLSTLMEEKEKAYRNTASGQLKTFEGAREFIQELAKKNTPRAVASSGSLEKIKFSLLEVGLLNYFNIIASSEEVPRGKPAPDVFLLAAERLGIDPSNCIVIEDSINGALAALEAGMDVYGFPGSFSSSDFQKIGVPFLRNGYTSLRNIDF